MSTRHFAGRSLSIAMAELSTEQLRSLVPHQCRDQAWVAVISPGDFRMCCADERPQ